MLLVAAVDLHAANAFGAAGFTKLAEQLPLLTQLSSLNYSCKFPCRHPAAQPCAPDVNGSVLAANDLGAAGAAALGKVLAQCAQPEIDLSRTRVVVCTIAAATASIMLLPCADACAGTGCKIGDSGMQQLSLALPTSRLKSLLLEGASCLCLPRARTQGDHTTSTSQCPSPVPFRANNPDNQIGPVGAARLAAVLPHCTSLESLDLQCTLPPGGVS